MGFGATYSDGQVTVTPPASSMVTMPKHTDAAAILGRVAAGAGTYYSTLAQIDAAKLNRQLLKAEGQAAVATARAGGQNAAQAAFVGLPSPSLLVAGGLALAAILILKR